MGSAAVWPPRTAEKYLHLVEPKAGQDYRCPTNIETNNRVTAKTGTGVTPVPVFFHATSSIFLPAMLFFDPCSTDCQYFFLFLHRI